MVRMARVVLVIVAAVGAVVDVGEGDVVVVDVEVEGVGVVSMVARIILHPPPASLPARWRGRLAASSNSPA